MSGEQGSCGASQPPCFAGIGWRCRYAASDTLGRESGSCGDARRRRQLVRKRRSAERRSSVLPHRLAMRHSSLGRGRRSAPRPVRAPQPVLTGRLHLGASDRSPRRRSGPTLAIPTWPKEWRDPHRRCGRSHLGESTSGANLLEAAVAGSMRTDMYVQMHHHASTNLMCADLRFARRRDRLRPQTPCAAGCRPLRARRKVRTRRLDLGGCGSLGVTLASSGRLLLLGKYVQGATAGSA